MWHHIAVTYNSTTNFLQIYTDGTPDGSGTTSISQNAHDLYIGTFYSYNFKPWDGSIDDLKFFSKELNATEILGYYDSDFRTDYGDVRFYDNGTLLDYEIVEVYSLTG